MDRRYEIIKSATSITVSVLALSLSYIQAYTTINHLISSYVYIDLFYTTQWDMFIHHVSTLLLLTSVRNVQYEIFSQQTNAIVNMEISTIFLGFMTLFRERVIRVGNGLALVNRIAFMVTFTKFRIWDYFWQIIMINEYPNAKTKAALITLFLLDCYWFILICKKAMKQF
jgi:hypothetical protein